MRSLFEIRPVLVSLPEHDMRDVWIRMQGMEDALRMQHEVIQRLLIQLALSTRPSYRGMIHEEL